MAEDFPFIGRKAEMAIIEKALSESESSQLLFLHSEKGGVGKTRILQEVYARYSKPTSSKAGPLLVLPIIDFDDREVNSRGTLERRMVEKLGDERFASYLRKMLDWRKLEAVGVSMERLEEESTRVRLEFQKCLNQLAEETRIVFLLDTTEKVEGKEIWDFLRAVLFETKNVIIIMAGRNTKGIYEKHFQSATASFNRVLILLEPFSSEESENYLERKLTRIKQAFNPETVTKIKSLSRGIPILFDLAIERLAQDDRFAELLSKKPTQYFETLSKEGRSKSENLMVSYLADQRSDLSELVLLLAHVYPANKNMLKILLRLDSAEEVESLLKRASSTVYIKQLPGGRISLHDEMRRMINEHVWSSYDPNGLQRKEYSRKAADFFEEDIEYLSKQIQALKPTSLQDSVEIDNLTRRKDSAQIEYLRHLLITDPMRGVDYYLRTVDDARKSHRLRFAQKMGGLIKEIEPELDAAYQYKVEIARIKQVIDSGHKAAPQAREALLHLQEKFSQPEYELEILNLLGVSETLMGQYEQALAHEEEVLGRLTKKDATINVSNYIGYIYRLQGDWQSATKYYKSALEMSQESMTVSPNAVAAIYNNLAYVVCLMGNYVEAREYCLEAIRIWESIGRTNSLGRGYLTRAIIYRDRGKYKHASTYFRWAIEIFEKLEEPDDYKNLASAYFEYAWSQWFEGDMAIYDDGNLKTADELYKSSKKKFDLAKELAENYELISLLPAILNQMSNVYWQLNLKDEARRLLEDAYRLSRKYNDIKHQVDSLLGFAEFDADEGKFDRIAAYAQQLKIEFIDHGYEFPLFYGRMKRIQAEAAVHAGDEESAKQLYADGLAQISLHGGYGMYFLDRELDRIKELMLQKLSPSTILKWLIFFKSYWKEHANQQEEKRGKLLSWSNTFITQVKFGHVENEN